MLLQLGFNFAPKFEIFTHFALIHNVFYRQFTLKKNRSRPTTTDTASGFVRYINSFVR